MRSFTLAISISCALLSQMAIASGPSKYLLQTFSSSCPSVVTRSVQASLAHVQGLVHTIEQLRDDSSCPGSQELLAQALRYQYFFEQYQVEHNTQGQRITAEQQVAYYTSLLTRDIQLPGTDSSDPLDPITRSYLEQEIIYSQADIISLNQELARFNHFQGRYAQAATDLMSGVESSLRLWSQAPKCFKQNREIVANMVSASMMATAAFAPPGASLALAGGAVLAQSLGEFTRNYSSNRSIKRLDDITWPTAFRCVSQSLSEQYCQADETLQLVDQYRRDLDDDGQLLFGIELLTHHVRQLDHWLKEVVAGSPISSEGDLINRSRPILQAELLQKINRYLQTFSTIRQQVFMDATSVQQRSDAIAIAIEGLVQIMESPTLTPGTSHMHSSGNREVQNPIFLTRESDILPFTLYDPQLTARPFCGTMECARLVTYLNHNSIVIGMDDWERAYGSALGIVSSTLSEVNLQRARSVSLDTFGLLVRANADHRGETNALKGLEKIITHAKNVIEYLKAIDHRSERNYAPQILNTQKTLKLTQTLKNLIEEGLTPGLPSDHSWLPEQCQQHLESNAFVLAEIRDQNDEQETKSFLVTSCITELLKLSERGNDVYFTKIRDMVSYELEARYSQGDFDDFIESSLLYTRSDLVQSLLETFHSDGRRLSLLEFIIGLKEAQSLSDSTLQEFSQTFRRAIRKLMRREYHSELLLADLCFRALPFLTEQDQRTFRHAYRLCKDVELHYFEEGPKILWSDFIAVQRRHRLMPTRRRVFSFVDDIKRTQVMCSLRNFYQKSQLIEQRRTRRR